VPSSACNTTGAETHLERKWSPVNQRTELASGEILTGTILSVGQYSQPTSPSPWSSCGHSDPRHYPPPLLRASGECVPTDCQCKYRVGGYQSGQAVMIINTSRVIQHKRKSDITKIKSPTATRRRAL
jgi:hypothetical protein